MSGWKLHHPAMKVFVAGATGVLGHRVVDELDSRGHDVLGLARDQDGADTVEEAGGRPVEGDVLEADTLRQPMEEADAVVNAATAIPTSTKPTREEWRRNDRVRRKGSRNLVDAAEEADVDRYLQESVVWVASRDDGGEFDETSPVNPDGVTESAADGEDNALSADVDSCVLRNGWFYAEDAAHTRNMAERLMTGDLPVVGGGLLGRRDGLLSMVHPDDAARAYADAVESSYIGVLHVVDDEPASFSEFAETLAELLDAPEPGRVPAWLARFFIGRGAAQLLSTRMPTSNEKAREVLDWRPRYPSYREGLETVVERWREEGFV